VYKHEGGFWSEGNDAGFYGKIRYDKKGKRIDNEDARSVGDLAALIHDGHVVFCKKCNITLTGCRIATTGNFAERLGKFTQCVVNAGAGNVSGEKAPVFASEPGEWEERKLYTGWIRYEWKDILDKKGRPTGKKGLNRIETGKTKKIW